jgi:hypothetical protein
MIRSMLDGITAEKKQTYSVSPYAKCKLTMGRSVEAF